MMNYLSNGRNQQIKGLKIKHALQLTLLLAVGIWLLYQIKHSHEEERNHGGNARFKLSQQRGVIELGRKGNAAWSSDRGDSDSEDPNIIGENEKKLDSSKTGNEEAYRDSQENAKTESFLKEKKEIIAAYEERVKLNNASVVDKYEAVKENFEDGGSTKRGSRAAVQIDEMVNVTITDHKEMEAEAHSFQDVNGVPQDLVNDYQKINLHQAACSHIIKSTPVEGEDGDSKEDRVIPEIISTGTLVDSENDIKAEAVSETSCTNEI